MHDAIVEMSILDLPPSSDHLPLSALIELPQGLPRTRTSGDDRLPTRAQPGYKWDGLSAQDRELYWQQSDAALSRIRLPHDTISCTNPRCHLATHIKAIDVLYDDICDALLRSSDRCVPRRFADISGRCHVIPGWNELMWYGGIAENLESGKSLTPCESLAVASS
jgi:hypothetical protein